MKKIIIFIFSIIISCCARNDKRHNYIILQENVLEEMIYENKLDILNTINQNIVDRNYEKVKDVIRTIDINNYIGGFYSLLKNEEMEIKEKIELLKYLTENNISNSFILLYIKPNEYNIYIKEFNININNKIDEFGRTVLHYGVRLQNTELLDYLLENGININSLDNNGHTALFYDFEFYPIDWYNPVIEDDDIVKFNYANDNYFYGKPYYSRKIKTTDGRVEYILNRLLENNINVNKKTNYGWTILHFSIFSTTEYVYNILLSYGADENILTNYGRRPKDLEKYRE
jgi:ankyrin repeat protein